jgi:CHAD domain-containing protein
VHDIRVAAKRFRSLSRLVVTDQGGRILPDATPLIREIKENFAAARDAEVMRKTLLASPEEAGGTHFVEDFAHLFASAALDFDKLGRKTLQQVDELEKVVAQWPLASLALATILSQVGLIYRRGDKLFVFCQKHRDDEAMHDWRKRVKDLGVVCTALSTLTLPASLLDPIDSLSDGLGEYHDLAVLDVFLHEHGAPKRLREEIRSRKKTLRKECFRRGEEVFKISAGKFRKILLSAPSE